MAIVTATSVPEECALRALLPRASFFDAYRCALNDQALTPVQIFIRAAKRDAAWVSWLMRLRNLIVRHLGLKDVGEMTVADGKPASAYQAGDRLGIFSILSTTEAELLLGIDDTHLDVRVSLLKRAREGDYVVSTVVETHNRLGRLYMLPVSHIHPLVVKSFMRRAEA
jgi:hypothetical protein